MATLWENTLWRWLSEGVCVCARRRENARVCVCVCVCMCTHIFEIDVLSNLWCLTVLITFLNGLLPLCERLGEREGWAQCRLQQPLWGAQLGGEFTVALRKGASQGRRGNTTVYSFVSFSPSVDREKPKATLFPALPDGKLSRIPNERPGHLFTSKNILLKHFKCTWV